MAIERTNLPLRLRRVLEVAYGVEGVVAARVWQTDQGITVAVTPSPTAGPVHILRLVESALSALQQPGESWNFGLLEPRA